MEKSENILYLGCCFFLSQITIFYFKKRKNVTFFASVIFRKLHKLRDIICVHFMFCAFKCSQENKIVEKTTGKLKDLYLLHSHIPLK